MWQQGRGSRWYHGAVARVMLLHQNKQTCTVAFMLWTGLVTSSCTQITHVAYSARAEVLFLLFSVFESFSCFFCVLQPAMLMF